MQETLHQTADAGDTLSDSGSRSLPIRRGCRRLSISKRMQESLYQTAEAGDTLSDTDAGDSCIRCLIESLIHLMSERETSASAV